MRRLADSLKINMEDAENSAKAMMKNENKQWSLKQIEGDIANQKMNGNTITII